MNTVTVGHALITINAEAVTRAWRNANRHNALAIAARRAGDAHAAWENTANARFYREAALGYITGAGR